MNNILQGEGMQKKLILMLAMVLVAASSWAQSVELNLNDTSVQVRYEHPLYADDYGLSLVNTRLLFNDDENTVLGSIGLDFVGSPGNVPGLKVGVGSHLYAGKTQRSQALTAVGIGLRSQYAPPRLGGLGVEGRVLYSPKILTFIDAERLLETAVRLGFAVTPKVRLFAEYQRVGVDFENYGTWTIDEGVRGGFQALF
jgi:hypothetical protein